MSSTDPSSNNPAIQRRESPLHSPKETPVETPKETGKYSSGAPKDNGMTRGETVVGSAKISRD
jgi:hypothetical protein